MKEVIKQYNLICKNKGLQYTHQSLLEFYEFDSKNTGKIFMKALTTVSYIGYNHPELSKKCIKAIRNIKVLIFALECILTSSDINNLEYLKDSIASIIIKALELPEPQEI